MNIALIDDDPLQCKLISSWLEGAGHQCHCYPDSEQFRELQPQRNHQMLLLDWELPGQNGLELLKWLRKELAHQLPVMFITVHDEEQNIVQALRSGADDYLTKPVREQELLARIEALARRGRGILSEEDRENFGPFTIDPRSHLLHRNGKPIALTQKEYALACHLLKNIGKLLSREELLEQVWGHASNLNTRTVDTHISRLRKKLSLLPELGWQLNAIYQQGYRLDWLGEVEPEM